MKNRTIILLLLAFILPLQAQEENISLSLTLDNVIALAREQSPMATAARHQFRRSYWEYRAYKASFLPSLTLNTELPDFNRSFERNIQDDGTEKYVQRNSLSSSLNLELSQNIGLTGGNISVFSTLEGSQQLDGASEPSFLSNPIYIGITQPLNGYNAYKWEKKIEPAKYEEAKKELIYTLEQVGNRAVGYFFDLILAQINLEIAKKNFANNDTLYHIASGRYQLGTIAENELLQMELSWLNAGTALNASSIDLEVKQFRLRSFLGYNEKVDIQLVVPSSIPEVNIDLAKALQEAYSNNPEIMNMDRRLIEAAQNVDQAKSQKGLQANLVASYGLSNNADNLAMVYQDPKDLQRLRLGLEVPILDWGQGRGNYKMAQSYEDVVKTEVEQLRSDFDQNVFLQVMQFNLQDDQLVIAAKADTIAAKRYEVTKQRFLIGKIDVLDLNVALEEKDVARRGYVQALRNYWDYFYSLRILTLYDWLQDERLEQDFNEVLLK